MKNHTPKQWERINAFLEKADKEDRLPTSYYAHIRCEADLRAWEFLAASKARLLLEINPFIALRYALTRELPEVKNSRSMRNCISSALIEVAKLGQVKRGEGLIQEMKADVNYIDSNGCTPLYYAIARKRLGMAEMLLKNGADNAKQGGDSPTPLTLACAMGFWQAIPLFLKYGIDINQPTKVKSWNKFHLGYHVFYAHPLSMAIANNQAKICQILLDKGAKLDPIIHKGVTIRDFADRLWKDFTPEMKTVFAPIIRPEQPQKVSTHPAVFPELPAPQNKRV